MTRPQATRIVRTDRLPKTGKRVKIDADEEERAHLAARFGLLALGKLCCWLQFEPWKRDGVCVTGNLAVSVTHACVLTLEPVEQPIDVDFRLLYVASTSSLAAPLNSDTFYNDAEDLPEVFEGQELDAGAIMAELLADNLELFPKKPGVTLVSHEYANEAAGDTDELRQKNPFEILKSLNTEKK